jgi:TatD DNase family protein
VCFKSVALVHPLVRNNMHHRGMAAARWIDTHCHLDAPEFDADRDAVLARAQAAGVSRLVMPAVAAPHFDAMVALAGRTRQAFALGIHPLFVPDALPQHLDELDAALVAQRHNPLLVAVGEIGLDLFVPGLDLALQEHFYASQLKRARAEGLPVILHVRRSADLLLKQLRRTEVPGGIAHAFNGSLEQALAFVAMGFKLGFGGAMSFERALQIRRLAQSLPAEAIVLETDAPDIPPHWLYKTAEQRAAGEHSRNEPAELPRIASVLAGLRGWTLEETAAITRANALAALPRLAAWESAAA